MADGMDVPSYLLQLSATITKYGVALQGVFPTNEDEGYPFVYTVGLDRRSHPEFLMYGLSFEQVAPILNGLAERVIAGEKFEAGKQDGVLERYSVWFVEIRPEYNSMFNMARLLGSESVRCLQIVWPDSKGRFPWELGFEYAFAGDLVFGASP